MFGQPYEILNLLKSFIIPKENLTFNNRLVVLESLDSQKNYRDHRPDEFQNLKYGWSTGVVMTYTNFHVNFGSLQNFLANGLVEQQGTLLT